MKIYEFWKSEKLTKSRNKNNKNKKIQRCRSASCSRLTRYVGDTPGPCFGLTGTYHLDRKDPPGPTKWCKNRHRRLLCARNDYVLAPEPPSFLFSLISMHPEIEFIKWIYKTQWFGDFLKKYHFIWIFAPKINICRYNFGQFDQSVL